MSVRWSSLTKGIVVVGLLVLGLWLLNRFNALIAPVVVALLLAYILNRPVNVIARRTGLSRTWSGLLVFLAVLLLLAAIPVLFGPPLVSLATSLRIDLRVLEATMERFFAEPIILFNLRIEPQSLFEQAMSTIGNLMSPLATQAVGVVASAAGALGWFLFVFVVAFLLVRDVHYFAREIGARIPPTLAPDTYRLSRELGEVWDAYLRGQLLISIVVGFLTTGAYGLLGLPSALGLGFLAGVLNFVPSIGAIIAAIPAVLVAWIRGSSYLPLGSLGMVLLVIAVSVIIGQIETLYLRPVLVGRRVHLHPVVVIIGTVAGALIGGILGILLAAPVIASARVLLGYTYRKLLDLEPFEAPPEPAQVLGVQWRGYIRGRPVEAVLFDLDGTLVETDDRAVAALAERLVPMQRILPGQNPVRTARRLVMWTNDWLNRWMSVLDRLGLDLRAQHWARRLHLLEDHTDGYDLVPVNGTVALMHELGARYRLGIVSTRREEEIRAYLDQYALQDEIDIIAGYDTTERIKPHPEPVLWASERLGVAPEQVAMVGDTAADVQAAKAAGALAVAVLCGFGERHDFAQADLILDSTAELKEWL